MWILTCILHAAGARIEAVYCCGEVWRALSTYLRGGTFHYEPINRRHHAGNNGSSSETPDRARQSEEGTKDIEAVSDTVLSIVFIGCLYRNTKSVSIRAQGW